MLMNQLTFYIKRQLKSTTPFCTDFLFVQNDNLGPLKCFSADRFVEVGYSKVGIFGKLSNSTAKFLCSSWEFTKVKPQCGHFSEKSTKDVNKNVYK